MILDAEPLEQENGLVVDDPRSTDRDETPISPSMGRSVIGLCGGFAMVVGGYVPALWGASSFSLVSIIFGLFGAVAGVWLGRRVSDTYI